METKTPIIKIPLTLSGQGFLIKKEEIVGVLKVEEGSRYKTLETEKYKIEMEYEYTYNRTQNVYDVEILIDEKEEIIILNINGDESILPIETFVANLDEEFFFSIKRKN